MRRGVLCCGLTLACALLAPIAAHAQTATDDPLDTAMIRIGPVGINPSIALRNMGVDDNVFNDPEHPKSDFTFTVTPKAEVLFRPRRLHLAYTTSTDYVYYHAYASERGTNQSSQVRAEFDLGRLQPYAAAGGASTRERYNQEVDSRARHHDRTYAAGAALRLASRTSVSAAVRQTRVDFDEGSAFRGEDLARAFNSTIDAVEGTFGLQLTPLTGISLVVTREQQRFDLDPDRDSDTTRVTPTITFSPGALLNGSAAVGYRRFNGKSPSLADFSGLVAVVNLSATILGRNRLDTTFARDVRYSYQQDVPYYLATGGSATLTTLIGGPFDVKITGTRQGLDYRRSEAPETRGSADTYTSYGGGVGYRLRQRMRLGVDAEWVRRRSDRTSGREFHNRRIFASLSWGTR
jgi:hypothetical protein